ncbi:uncharacterized protein LOC113228750 [Hyposmocoma kahamanoa]|uniref:uncharacterized protein LOC113228750 n=1 Tax=Hyposmocoma kahamanoa TaxID=1477025 RepID=UPI000E6DA1FB|nr:uncharacterized protein LOC113228750 [Hyposmocoma kahamanoa]
MDTTEKWQSYPLYNCIQKTMKRRLYLRIIVPLLYTYLFTGCVFALCWISFVLHTLCEIETLPKLSSSNTTDTRRNIEIYLEKSLELDNGTVCQIPQLNPFSPEIMKFDKKLPQIVCTQQAWVKCHLSKCQVIPSILKSVPYVKCTYRNIIYLDDALYYVSKMMTDIEGAGVYVLEDSDHVMVNCSGIYRYIRTYWEGVAAGFRKAVEMPPLVPPGREDTVNVLIFAFDSLSRNGFIRKMPDSYKFLKFVLNATILTGFNVVGEATVATVLPLLTGRTEWDFPESRKSSGCKRFNTSELIFHKVKLDGYRTAYFEDQPDIGTFQFRFNGFIERPADHYLYDFYKVLNRLRYLDTGDDALHCIGDIPKYEFIMKITEQYFKLDGKKFCFSFTANPSHDDFNKITSADTAFVRFLQQFRSDGHLRNTLLLVMGDHGVRYEKVRATVQGKLEHRLPLMAIVLPEKLLAKRPEIESALQSNEDVLTTPYDIYATILDAIDMREHWNPYKIKGAHLTRGLTLFEPIPRTRLCSEAGIETHWCACIRWEPVPPTDSKYHRVAASLVNHINFLTEPLRMKCAKRKLISISYVLVYDLSRNALEPTSKYQLEVSVYSYLYIDKSKATTFFRLLVEANTGMPIADACVAI